MPADVVKGKFCRLVDINMKVDGRLVNIEMQDVAALFRVEEGSVRGA